MVAEAAHLFDDSVPDVGDGGAELLIGVPEVHEGSDQRTDDGYDRHNRRRDPTECCAQLTEQSGCTAHPGGEQSDALCQRTESSQSRTNCRYGLSQYNEQRTDGRSQSRHLEDGFSGAVIHAVELVHECLHRRHDLADGGHQEVAKRNSQLFQLRFQNGELTI